jgi:hypothetical protein
MKKQMFLLLVLSGLLIIAFGQGKMPEFGKADMGELAMKECAFEKNASAMYLIKTAQIGFEINGFTRAESIRTEYRIRIKIFNEEGFSAANIRIPYISKSRSSKVEDVAAYIYSLDNSGKISREKVEKKEILNEKSNAKKSLNYVAFTFPNLKAGSVIEYRYARVDKNSMSIPPWFFQDIIPTAYSRITVVVPAFVSMSYHILTFDPVERDSSFKRYYRTIYNEETRSFALHNIHSFVVEPMMTSLKDNLERVEFSLSPGSLARTFLSDASTRWRLYNFYLLNARFFGLQIGLNIDGTDHFIDSVKNLSRKEDKISAVYEYVKRNVDWNGDQTFYCDSLDACWRNKSGSSAEINFLLLNFLRKVGVDCYPILVSTRENGNPDVDFASLSQFNGVDVLVVDSTKSFTVDGTQKDLSSKMPPFDILNSYGYLIDVQKYGWVFIMDRRILMKREITIDATMDSSGNIKGTASSNYIGFAKSQTLEEARKKKETIDAKQTYTPESEADLTMDSVLTESKEEDNDTLKQKLSFHLTTPATDKVYFLKPSIFFAFKKNPFKDTARFSDIDFGSNQSIDVEARIQIPKNFIVESLPKDISIQKKDSAIAFERKIVLDGGTLLVHHFFVVKNTVFIKEEYRDLKSFFDRFYALLGEDILLKRKD